MRPAVSVLMPTYGQAAFLPRAVASLREQTLTDWELVIVDDGSPDDTVAVVAALAPDPRIRVVALGVNRGLGAALNAGLDASTGPLVAYLPSDDVLHAEHLQTLVAALGPDDAGAVAARRTAGTDDDVQLVQLLHRRGAERWTERDELETDDLELLGLARLRARGTLVDTGRVTCEWTQHPAQRHRAIRERTDGGLNAFRRRYRVREPLRFAPSDGAPVDEHARYARFAGRPAPRRDPGVGGLKIALAGELAFNPDRILALEERGHELVGLWIDDPLGWMTVGPLPFGHVRDLPRADWRAALRDERPDVVYALLNWRCVGLAQAILDADLGIRFVFHFKEAPQRSLERGDWPVLADVVVRADACVFASAEERAWFCAALPALDPSRAFVLDGDLPKREWLAGARAERLSARDGEVHTLLAGRPYGWTPELRDGLAARGIHVHVHAGRDAVGPEDWVGVLSRYDAAWLHPVRAANDGDVRAAVWDDLNLPARIPTLLAAGLPLIAPRSPAGAVHAAQRVLEETGAGVLYGDLDELAELLRDEVAMAARRGAAWEVRERFTFDHHADRLIEILRG